MATATREPGSGRDLAAYSNCGTGMPVKTVAWGALSPLQAAWGWYRALAVAWEGDGAQVGKQAKPG